jgi:uncharacterized protein YfcZ (UPF0381/DUF406 family)
MRQKARVHELVVFFNDRQNLEQLMKRLEEAAKK